MRITLRSAVTSVVLVAATSAAAWATDMVLAPRVYNDMPEAGYTMSVGGDSANAHEFGLTGHGLNRDDVLISDDGMSPKLFGTTDYFTLSGDITLSSPDPAAAVEAGLRIYGPTDTQVVVHTNGDRVSFLGGWPFPFFNFSAGHPENDGYLDRTYNMTLQYLNVAGTNGIIVTMNGVSSGFQAAQNAVGGVEPGSKVGFYFQMGNGEGYAEFKNIKFGTTPNDLVPVNATPASVPEPGSFALLAVGTLPLLGLRRRK